MPSVLQSSDDSVKQSKESHTWDLSSLRLSKSLKCPPNLVRRVLRNLPKELLQKMGVRGMGATRLTMLQEEPGGDTLADRLGPEAVVEDYVIQMRKKEQEHRRVATHFLVGQDGQLVEQLHVVKSVLAPQIKLMQQLLRQDDEYDHACLQHFREGGAELLRLPSLACWSLDGGLVFQAVSDLARKLRDESQWRPMIHTEAMAGSILRHATRAGGVLYESLQRPTENFPLRLFRLLRNDNDAREVLALSRRCPCLLDAFSASYLATFPTEERLTSHEAKLLLATACLQARGEHTHNREPPCQTRPQTAGEDSDTPHAAE